MIRIVGTIALVVLLVSLGFFWRLTECEAQNKIAPVEYDYYSLALTSIQNSASEASKLPDIPKRVNLLLYAAKIVAPFQRDEAVRFLDVALGDLKQWASEDEASWYQRHTAATLRNEVLALYARLDPEKAVGLEKESVVETEANSDTGAVSLKRNDWFRQFDKRRTIADQPATMAFSLLDTDPERAAVLVVQSLQEGVVSSALCDVVKKLIQSGNRSFLTKLEIAMGQMVAQNVALDPFSLPYAAEIVQSDRDMPAVARTAFVGFFMRSLENAANVLGEPGINADYIRMIFTMFSLNARPIILQYAPEQLLAFDLLLDQVAPFVSEQTRATLQAFQPEKLAEPRNRLADILRDPAPARRELRLVRLVSELLRKEGADAQGNFDLAADAISGFSDPDNKAAFTDLLTITRINALVKKKNFIEAQQLAGSISSEETRAWALLALATVAAKADRVLGFELISNALKALDKASPSPHKVELALIATGMLAKNDPQRAFDTLSVASKYANSSPSKIDPPTKPAVAFGLEATIGEAHTKLGVFPESLGELKIDPSLSILATTDWFRADQIANDIREPALRLQLKLQFAEAMLAQESKSRKKEVAPKPAPKTNSNPASPK